MGTSPKFIEQASSLEIQAKVNVAVLRLAGRLETSFCS